MVVRSPCEGEAGWCMAKGPIVVRAIKEQERYNGLEMASSDVLGGS